MLEPDSQEPLSNLSDSSFVILGQGSLPPQKSEDFNQNHNSNSLTDTKTIFSVIESTNPSSNDNSHGKWLDGSILSQEDIQKKLDELIRENYQLKETLSQNNLAIKSQLDTFFMWQQEVLKTHETHKQKFLETKDLILKLRAENLNLKKKFDGSSIENDIYAEVNKKPEELRKLTERLREYEEGSNDIIKKHENLQSENQKLREELGLTKAAILKLNKELEDVGRENIFLKQKSNEGFKNSLEIVSKKSISNSEECFQIRDLLKQLEQEKGKVLQLKEELKKTKARSPADLCKGEELSDCAVKLDDLNLSLDMHKQRCNSLQSWVSLAEENIKENKNGKAADCDLVSKMKELKTHLNQEENVSRKKQEPLEELQKQYNHLLEDYKSLQLKLSAIKNNESNIEKLHESLCSLQVKLKQKDEQLLLKQQECNKLNEDIKKLNLECEEVDVLRLQVKLFQSDFNCERAAREKLVGEKEDLAEQIRLLQSKLESLGKKPSHLCPKCNFSFSDLTTLQEHVEDCVNIHFYP